MLAIYRIDRWPLFCLEPTDDMAIENNVKKAERFSLFLLIKLGHILRLNEGRVRAGREGKH